MPEIVYTGLREIAQALHELDREAYVDLKEGLEEVGDLVRDDARERFLKYDRKSAAGFETRIRATAETAVVVGQSLRKTTGLRPDWGALQMTEALLPAREEKLDEAAPILEARIGATLAEHGF